MSEVKIRRRPTCLICGAPSSRERAALDAVVDAARIATVGLDDAKVNRVADAIPRILASLVELRTALRALDDLRGLGGDADG